MLGFYLSSVWRVTRRSPPKTPVVGIFNVEYRLLFCKEIGEMMVFPPAPWEALTPFLSEGEKGCQVQSRAVATEVGISQENSLLSPHD